MVRGRTRKAFNYIYIGQGKYNKLAPTGEAYFSPSVGLKASRVALKGTRAEAEAILGRRQMSLKLEEVGISLTRLGAQFILPFPTFK